MHQRRKEITIAILLSLCLHILMLILGSYYSSVQKVAPKEQIIQIDLKDDKNWKIADIAKPKVEKVPEKAEHIGMYNSSVPEETVATGFARPPGRPVTRGGEGIEKFKKEEVKVKGKREEGGLHEFKEKKLAKKGGGEPEPLNKGARPGSMPEDFYPDYKRGAHTYLNVLKHPDVGYFVMLKRVFKMAWDPTHVLMMQRVNGEVSRGSINVVLGVAINKSGELKELFVLRGSGNDGYDQEALRAVKVSSPFGPPPEKILQPDGILRVSWTFVVYM